MPKTVEKPSKPPSNTSKKAADAQAAEGLTFDEGRIRGMPPTAQYYRPRKVQITLRVDADVIAWFRKNHPRYQTLMNAVLRKEMMGALEEEAREKASSGREL